VPTRRLETLETTGATSKPEPALAGGMTVRRPTMAALRQRFRDGVAELESRAHELADDPNSAKAVHAFRKQAHLLAAQADALEMYLTPTDHHKLVALVAPVRQGLGRLRDWDVLAKRVARLGRGRSRLLKRQLAEALEAARPPDRKRRVAAACRRARPKRLRRPVEEILARMHPRSADVLAIPEARLRQRLRPAVLPGASFAGLHAFRLSLKAYRHAVALASPEGPGPIDRQAHAVTALLGQVTDAHQLAQAAGKAAPLAARTLLAAARRDGDAARRAFEEGWMARKWRHLEAVVVPSG